MVSLPQVSVVIPAFRRQKYILEAVQSVLASDVQRESYEILLVVDKVTPELERRLGDLGVRVYLSDTPFVGETLATGVLNARGEIVAFLDDDDRFHGEKLRTLLEVFADPKVLYYHHGFRRVRADGSPIGTATEIAPASACLPVPLSRGAAGRIRRMGGFYNTSSIAVRRSALLPQLSTLRRLTTAQDFSMLLLISGPGEAVVDGTKVLVDYRTHISQATHHFEGDRLMDEHVRFLEGTARSFEILQEMAPTAAARKFSLCRVDSYGTLVWAVVGHVVTKDPRMRLRATRAVLGNLRERDLRSATVLGSLVMLSTFSRNWALRFYIRLKRTEQAALGFDTAISPSTAAGPT